jgi:hypothetical protein
MKRCKEKGKGAGLTPYTDPEAIRNTMPVMSFCKPLIIRDTGAAIPPRPDEKSPSGSLPTGFE